MTRREAVLRLREWYKAFANFGKGNERTVKEFLEIEDLIHSMDAELTLVKKERDDLRKGMEAATSLLDEYAQTFPRWISVEERLPEDYEDVVIIMRNGASSWYRVAYREYGGWSFGGGRRVTDEVTHWMPIPQAPKEE